ncbi:hypothetical protein ACI1S5_07530 [Lactococcus petauri]|uniref:YobI family P-loop NTPase n=1 Tax=Lactococcus petauri TaxID=1940789 RepID=UPI003851FB21
MNQKKEAEIPLLQPLTPTADIDNSDNYKRYFDEALKDKRIKNIALSGNYGSGKSSILLNYFEISEYQDKKIQVSLADFRKKEDKKITDKENLATIEKNIINQILYQIPTSKIPLTNFKIKREISNFQKLLIISEVLLICSVMFLDKNVLGNTGQYIIYALLLTLVIWNIWLFLKYIPIKKISLKLKNIEAEINQENDELFEQYADEIVYLLEKSGKNILIIEDLDRFEQIKIFEKLRELNIKVNDKFKNSKKKKFTFIYAVKDDLFSDKKERTKFFDLIIPVVPYLNATNSYEKLKSLFTEYHTIDDDLLFILSFYIDDMRLLLNIHNEFVVYKKELDDDNSNETDDKLLALIVYKNIFNLDFEKLKFREGELYNVINSIENYKNDIRDKILELRKELSEIENDRKFKNSKTEEEVFTLWMMNNQSNYRYNFDDIKNFIAYPDRTFYYNHNNKGNVSSNYETLKQDTYFRQELDLALNIETVKEKNIKENISILEKKLEGKLKDIISEEENISENQKLVYRLIRQGYIDENYENYINYSYAEKNDNIFLKNIFDGGKPLKFDIELKDFNKILKVLNDIDYKKSAILNNTLLNHIIEQKDIKHVNDILNTSQKFEIGFIEQYYNKYSNIFQHLIRLKLKIDITKLDNIDNKLIENNLYLEDEKNYDLILLKIWKDRLTNEHEIVEVINDSEISEKFKKYFITNTTRNINLKNINSDYFDFLIQNNKINSSIENIQRYFEFSSNKINKNLIKFINENVITINSKVKEKFYDELVNVNEISNEKYEQFFKEYDFGSYTKDHIVEEIDGEKLKILVDLDMLDLSKEMIIFLDEKDISFIKNNEKEILQLLIENEDIIIKNWQTIFESKEVSNSEKQKLFIARINEFNFDVFKHLLEELDFDKGLLKVTNQEKAYLRRKFEDTKINRTVLEYLVSNNIIAKEHLNKMLKKK